MNKIAFYNGIFAPIDEIKIPLSDRAIYFGDGIYEAAIGRNNKIYLEDYHLTRFFENAKRLNLDSPCTQTGRCVNCQNDTRICADTVIIGRQMPKFKDRIKVILVGEELGY
jgi:branched-subunit amino acid aminotransferase/4-amino-4-deoxychorismate lyase